MEVTVGTATSGQQAMWFLNELAIPEARYNSSRHFRLVGPLDLDALERAVGVLVERHEVLRTSFFVDHGHPTPIVHHTGEDCWEYEVVDPEMGGRSLLLNLAAQRRRPFDLSTPRSLRVTLQQVTPVDHLLHVVYHQIAVDEPSVEVLLDELGRVYRALSAHRHVDLEPAIQIGEVVPSGAIGESVRRFWMPELADAPPRVDLPAHRPPAEHQHEGHTIRLELSTPLTAAIRGLASETGNEPSNVLLVSLALLLARWGGSNDIVIGTPFSGRGESTQQVVGPLENPLPVRVRLIEQQSFREMLFEVAATLRRVEPESAVPFADLVHQLGRAGSADGNPLFGVHIRSQCAEGQRLNLGNLQSSPLDPTTHFARYELDLVVSEHDDIISCSFTYSRDRFDDATMREFVAQYEHLLSAASEEPDAEALLLPLEQHSAALARVREVNNTEVAYPRDGTLAELFVKAVDAHADQVAIVDGERSLTFRDLGGLADQAARALARAGVTPGDFVEILVRPDIDTIVAMVATTLVGAAYVPLDPSLPAARLREIRSDAMSKVVVGDSRLARSLDIGPCTVVDVSSLGAHSAGEFTRGQVAADDPAYMIYTSGSTGRPKGVLVPHRSAIRQVINSDFLPLSPGDVVGQVSNLAFDVSVIEVWGPLLNGARIEMIPEDRRLDPERLVEFIRERGVTALFLSSLHFNAVIRDVPDALRSLDTFMVGADVVHPAAVKRAMVHGGPQRFLNAYGPTEASVWCSFAEIIHPPNHRKDLPIGRPASNNALYVLNASGGLAAPWEPGELYVGGDGVALGYWRQKTLTDESFTSDPFSDRAGARLYRTGDRVVQTVEGDLHFLGRVDRQVKIRGNRVELGEIEAKIAGLPGAGSALVTVTGEGVAQQLVGYVVRSTDSQLSSEDAIGELKTLLPSYMVPQILMVVDELPSNRRGKVDVDRLPTPIAPDPLGATEPPGRTERSIAQCFADVLGVDTIRTDRDFFDLGGHSLIALELLALIEERLGVRISLVSFMRHSSVQGLLDYIDATPEDEALALWEGGQDQGAMTKPASPMAGLLNTESAEVAAVFFRQEIRHEAAMHALRTSFKYRIGDALTSAVLTRSGARRAPKELFGLAREAWTFKRRPPVSEPVRQIPTLSGELEPIERLVGAWEGVRTNESSLLVLRNSRGKGRPLYWCFNGESELNALSQHFGPTIPIIGMRSAWAVCEPMSDMIPSLARRYAREIIEFDPTGPYVLGGNCAGGEVAFAVGCELERLDKKVELLILMERVVDAAYSGDVLLLFGDDSHDWNPYLSGAPSDELFERNYKSYRVDTLPGAHGSFFTSPNIEVLAATLRRNLDDPSADPLSPPILHTLNARRVASTEPQQFISSATRRTEGDLPPGDLARIDHGEHKDRRFLLDRSLALGPIFKAATSGNRLVVCVVGFEHCKRLLTEHAAKLGPNSMALGALFPKGIIREMHGEDHEAYRGTLVRALAGATALSVDDIARRAARQVLGKLAESNTPDDPQQLTTALNTIATNTLVEVFFGASTGTAEHSALVAGFDRLGPDGLVWVPKSAQEKAFAELCDRLWKVADTSENGGGSSVLHRLAANGDLDATSLGNLIYMVEIGRFDVASLMRWLVKLAAENPSVLQEIRSSHDHADHTSPLSDAFVLETLRLHQSERLMRIALEDLSFDGYHVPKHTVVRLCLWESHKDPETFEDPFRFDPRRFVDENYTSDQYAPFGLGRRRCPASDMAIAMAASLVSTMANDVRPSIIEDGPPIHGAWHWEPNPSMRVSWRLAESIPAEPGGSDAQAR